MRLPVIYTEAKEADFAKVMELKDKASDQYHIVSTVWFSKW